MSADLPRVRIIWPASDLHLKLGYLHGAERLELNGLDLGMLFDVELDGYASHFWLWREIVRLEPVEFDPYEIFF